MGPVRQRQLIRLSSVLVALNLVVGLSAVYAHSTGAAARASRARVPAGAAGGPSGGQAAAAGPDTGGGLGAGHFSRRRGSGTSSSTVAAPRPGPSPSPGSATSSGPGSTTAAAPTAPTNAAAPATTTPGQATPTPGAVAAPPTTSGGRTTTTTGKALATPPPGATVVTDPAGDTFVDGTPDPITAAPADVVRAGATYEPGAITFAYAVGQADDPRTDPKWASESTYAAFDIDTNGDGKPDFEVQYSYDGKAFAGEVIRPGDADSAPPVCDAAGAGYQSGAYWVTIPPSCIGDPPSFTFRLTTYYDTNPKNDNADVASDVAPNGGMSFPVTRPS